MNLILQYFIYKDFINLANTIADDSAFPYSRDICGWLCLGILRWHNPYEFVTFLYPLRKKVSWCCLGGGDGALVWIKSLSDWDIIYLKIRSIIICLEITFQQGCMLHRKQSIDSHYGLIGCFLCGVFIVLTSVSNQVIVGYKCGVMHWTSLYDLKGGDETVFNVVLFSLEIHAVVKPNRYNSPIRH